MYISINMTQQIFIYKHIYKNNLKLSVATFSSKLQGYSNLSMQCECAVTATIGQQQRPSAGEGEVATYRKFLRNTIFSLNSL